MSLEKILLACDAIEAKLKAVSDKADGELSTLGKVSTDTKAAMDNLSVTQRELADRILQLEQKGSLPKGGETGVESWGAQFIKSAGYKTVREGNAQRARIEVKNTVTGSDATVAPDRKPGIVAGASNLLTMEALYTALPTASNAIEYTREASYTNLAAETAEGALKPESALTFSLVNMPVSTVAHWIKISRQLAGDAPALAAYIDTRMRYGVQRKVEAQIVNGTGVAPNLSGFLAAGNFTAHGYAAAALGATLPKLVLIRKTIADLWNAGYMANAIVLNAADFATLETEIMIATATGTRIAYTPEGQPMLFGLPVVQSIGMTAGIFAVGDFTQHGTIYNREGVVVDMSESDADNFTKNLITLRAERRLALTSEVPAAVRGGTLTPL